MIGRTGANPKANKQERTPWAHGEAWRGQRAEHPFISVSWAIVLRIFNERIC